MKARSLPLSIFFFVLALPLLLTATSVWREATAAELSSLLPARAPVEQERIETEMRTAAGITNGHGKYVAGVVLITAGYSAEGKYSHYFLTQAPVEINGTPFPPNKYVFGYHRSGDQLDVRFYEATTGKPIGTAVAHRTETSGPIRSFGMKISGDHGTIVIGRYGIPFTLTE